MKSTSRVGEVGHDAHEIGAALQRRAGGADDRRPHLVGHDRGQRRLAEPGRAGQEHVVERLAAPPRRLHRDPQALDGGALPDVLVEALRPELPLGLRFFGRREVAGDPGMSSVGVALAFGRGRGRSRRRDPPGS